MAKPITGEPTHEDDDGVERPGAQSLTAVITPKMIADAMEAWASHYADAKHQNLASAQNSHINEPYTPLENLIMDAFERFGNMDATSIDANIKRILLRYANKIVEDVRIHPYGSTPYLDYYTDLQQTRPIPDEIMLSGIAYHYAKWQDSSKAKVLYAEYSQALNQILYQRKFGSGKIQLNTVDKYTGVK